MTTHKALLIEPTGEHGVIDVETTAEALHEKIGGWLEGVARGEDWIMYADEEGRLKKLAPNVLASHLIFSETAMPTPVVGRVLVVGMKWVGGEDGYADTDVPHSILNSPVLKNAH